MNLKCWKQEGTIQDQDLNTKNRAGAVDPQRPRSDPLEVSATEVRVLRSLLTQGP